MALIRVEAMEEREARVMSGIGVGNERISCLIKLSFLGGREHKIRGVMESQRCNLEQFFASLHFEDGGRAYLG
jgi:hypothetical protein